MIIKIIGDSSSSSIGEGENTYGYKLFKHLSKTEKVSIFNYSTIGATSSDQCMYFHQNLKNKKFDYLIIYLGNNECVYSTKKGYSDFYFWKLKNIFNFPLNYSNQNFLNKKFEFKDNISSKKIPNTTIEFYNNILSVVKICKKKEIKVILINPIANKNFLPSVKINNFEYLKFINLNEKIFSNLKYSNEESKALIEGIKKYENLNYEESKNIFKKLIRTSKSEIIKLISANNLAVTMYKEKKYDGAIKIYLDLIERNKSEFESILYFNLSLVYKKINNLEKYHFYKDLSYSSDLYSYRVKEEYREIIDKISKKAELRILDLKDILNQKNFIDPCHPNEEGHEIIAQNLGNLILENKNKKSKNLDKNKFCSIFINPDYFNNPKKNFYDYYFIEKKISLDEISKNIQDYIKDRKCENTFILNFLNLISKYPFMCLSMFHKKEFLPQSHELSSYPENFIHKFMFNLIRVFENNFGNDLHKKYRFIKEKIFYKNIILRASKPDCLDLQNIEDAIPKNLHHNLINFIDTNISIFQNIAHLREKTFMKWYTRETFRFGTTSKINMLYDRVNLEILIESVIALGVKNKNMSKIDKIFDLIENLINVHKLHITEYLSGNINWHFNYENKLKDIKEKLKRDIINVQD